MRIVGTVRVLTVNTVDIREALLTCQTLSGAPYGGHQCMGSHMSRWDSCRISVSFGVMLKLFVIIIVKIPPWLA